MQADESSKWVYDPTPGWHILILILIGIFATLSGFYLFVFGRFNATTALYASFYSLLEGLPLVSAGLAETLVEILAFGLTILYALVIMWGSLFAYAKFRSNPADQIDGWVFATSVEIPYDPWQTLVIDLPDEADFSCLLALEVLLRTPIDLSSPSLLADRSVTDEPIYPNYDEENPDVMAALDREELFNPRLWDAEIYPNDKYIDDHDLAPLGYDTLQIDRQAFERVLDVASSVSRDSHDLPPPDRRILLEDDGLPSLDATLAEHDIAVDTRRFLQMKDARMQLKALNKVLSHSRDHSWDGVRFE